MNIYGLILFICISFALTGQNLFKQGYTQENQTNTEIPKIPKSLAIQYSKSGSISWINTTFTLKFTDLSNKTILSSDRLNTFHLKLNDISDKTILFSHKPTTINTSINTSNFINKWNDEVNYKENPNHGLLAIDNEVGEITLLDLSNPIYSKETNVIQYNFATFGNQTSFNFPYEFDQSTLMIDFS